MRPLVAIYLSRTNRGLADFPEYTIGDRLATASSDVTDWFTDTFGGVTAAFKDVDQRGLLNPMQALLAESPWYVAVRSGSVRWPSSSVASEPWCRTVICLAGIWYFDLWHDAMVTLKMTMVGTVLVMILALVFGACVWMARDR